MCVSVNYNIKAQILPHLSISKPTCLLHKLFIIFYVVYSFGSTFEEASILHGLIMIYLPNQQFIYFTMYLYDNPPIFKIIFE